MFLVQRKRDFDMVKEGYRPFHGNLPFMTTAVAEDIMCGRHCVRNLACLMFVVTGETPGDKMCELFNNQNMTNLVGVPESQMYTLQ